MPVLKIYNSFKSADEARTWFLQNINTPFKPDQDGITLEWVIDEASFALEQFVYLFECLRRTSALTQVKISISPGTFFVRLPNVTLIGLRQHYNFTQLSSFEEIFHLPKGYDNYDAYWAIFDLSQNCSLTSVELAIPFNFSLNETTLQRIVQTFHQLPNLREFILSCPYQNSINPFLNCVGNLSVTLYTVDNLELSTSQLESILQIASANEMYQKAKRTMNQVMEVDSSSDKSTKAKEEAENLIVKALEFSEKLDDARANWYKFSCYMLTNSQQDYQKALALYINALKTHEDWLVDPKKILRCFKFHDLLNLKAKFTHEICYKQLRSHEEFYQICIEKLIEQPTLFERKEYLALLIAFTFILYRYVAKKGEHALKHADLLSELMGKTTIGASIEGLKKDYPEEYQHSTAFISTIIQKHGFTDYDAAMDCNYQRPHPYLVENSPFLYNLRVCNSSSTGEQVSFSKWSELVRLLQNHQWLQTLTMQGSLMDDRQNLNQLFCIYLANNKILTKFIVLNDPNHCEFSLNTVSCVFHALASNNALQELRLCGLNLPGQNNSEFGPFLESLKAFEQNVSLKILSLGGLAIPDETIHRIAQSIGKKSTLKKLKLDRSGSLKTWCTALRNQNLLQLELHNTIDDYESVAELIRTNRVLQKISLGEVYSLTEKNLLVLGDALAVNVTLTTFEISIKQGPVKVIINECFFDSFFKKLSVNQTLKVLEFRTEQIITGHAFTSLLHLLKTHPTLREFRYNAANFKPEELRQLKAVIFEKIEERIESSFEDNLAPTSP